MRCWSALSKGKSCCRGEVLRAPVVVEVVLRRRLRHCASASKIIMNSAYSNFLKMFPKHLISLNKSQKVISICHKFPAVPSTLLDIFIDHRIEVRIASPRNCRRDPGPRTNRATMSATTGLTGPPQPPPRTVRQEVAPKGGYAQINVARNVPKSVGGGAGFLLLGTAAMMSYSFYRLGNFNVKRRCVLQNLPIRAREARSNDVGYLSVVC